MKHWLALAALACATACASVSPAPALSARSVPSGATVVLVEPEVRLGLLAVNARTIDKPAWSAAARTHLAEHARDRIVASRRQVAPLARAEADAAATQILLLHEAVRVSIRRAETADPPPPTLRGDRVWTLGAGARALATGDATHALIISCEGDFTSALRAAFVVGAAAAAGVLAPTGLTRASASLVDLESGDIVWRNSVVATPDQDVRDSEGARLLLSALLEGAPL